MLTVAVECTSPHPQIHGSKLGSIQGCLKDCGFGTSKLRSLAVIGAQTSTHAGPSLTFSQAFARLQLTQLMLAAFLPVASRQRLVDGTSCVSTLCQPACCRPRVGGWRSLAGPGRVDELLWAKNVRQSAYTNMYKLLLEYNEEAFPLDRKVQCTSCQQKCYVNPPEVRNRREAVAKVGGDFDDCQRFPKLLLNQASTTCVGWSSQGTRANSSHESMRPFYVWLAERRRVMEDIIFHENAYLFAAERILHKPLEDMYECVSFRVGPQDYGWLSCRILWLCRCGASVFD